MKPYALAAGAAVAIVLTSCGSSSTTTGSPSTTSTTPSADSPTTEAAPQGAGGITISSFKFTGQLSVKPGEKVTVTNKDSAPHTLTDVAGKFDTGNIAGNGGTGTFTAPSKAGSYKLKCKYHPRMAGSLTVAG